jgi:hypothetical protein
VQKLTTAKRKVSQAEAILHAEDPNVDDPKTWVKPDAMGNITGFEELAVNVKYPIPQDECNARPGEAACALGSRCVLNAEKTACDPAK